MRRAIAEADWEHRLITVSGGLATRDEPVSTATELIHRADQALYAAKRAGKNRICQAASGSGVNTRNYVG